LRGRPACRHGVLFSKHQGNHCPCMNNDEDANWSHARFMPALDHQLRTIVATKFEASAFRRLGLLQAEARRLGWRA
jgi:hypothetical protein